MGGQRAEGQGVRVWPLSFPTAAFPTTAVGKGMNLR